MTKDFWESERKKIDSIFDYALEGRSKDLMYTRMEDGIIETFLGNEIKDIDYLMYRFDRIYKGCISRMFHSDDVRHINREHAKLDMLAQIVCDSMFGDYFDDESYSIFSDMHDGMANRAIRELYNDKSVNLISAYLNDEF